MPNPEQESLQCRVSIRQPMSGQMYMVTFPVDATREEMATMVGKLVLDTVPGDRPYKASWPETMVQISWFVPDSKEW